MYRPTRCFPRTQSADCKGRTGVIDVVEFAHALLVDHVGDVKAFGRPR
jgi:hypothetical protein